MGSHHMLRYHILIPLGLFLVLLVAGTSFGTALVVAMMSGCVAMMFMMMGHGSAHAHNDRDSVEGRPRRS
jgi:hypothetical protein